MLLVEGLVYRFQPHETDPWVGLLGVLFMIGGLCSLVGLLRLQAAGQHWLGKAPLYIQSGLLTLALIWGIIHLVTPQPDREQPFYQGPDQVWPLSMIFGLVVGLAVLLAGQLPGWRRCSVAWRCPFRWLPVRWRATTRQWLSLVSILLRLKWFRR